MSCVGRIVLPLLAVLLAGSRLLVLFDDFQAGIRSASGSRARRGNLSI